MSTNDRKRLVLIDAHAILHRAYHALPQFSNSKGEPTGALYGLSAMLIKIISDLKPDYIASAYDLPKPTFRHEAYKDYKAGRAKAEPELISQMKRSREIFEAFSIPIYDKEGFEADDILGTIVEQLKNTDVNLIIATGDTDALQLVDDKKVQVYTLKKGINDTILYDEEKVKERFGFGPELLPDFKGLKGDPSDNIKGVAGIGDKTATDLIKNFGTIENIYKSLNTKRSTLTSVVKPRIVELLEKGKEDAEFSKILGTIRRDAPIKFEMPEKEWSKNVDFNKAEALFRELEFRTLGQRLEDAVGRNKKQVLFDEEPEQKSSGGVSVFSSNQPLELQQTRVALWLINSNLTNPTIEDALSFAKTKDISVARAKIFAELKARSLTRVFEEIEKPLIPVVEKMNEQGVKINVDYLKKLSKEYHKELSGLEKEIWKLAKGEFNINSPKQMGEVLFVKMGLKATRQKKTAGGALSTRESELEKMRELHPIIGKILEYREFQKLLSTYIDNIPEMVGVDGRLRANFLQTGTTTGRMASQNPNLQNIPAHSALGRRIRNAFVPENNFALLAFDYSQIELRIAAILSGDQKLAEIFKKEEDVHTAVAAEVFGVRLEEVTKEMRRRAKTINFGILYGMGVNALRQSLEKGGASVPREEAQKYLDEYFARFSTLSAYLEETKTAARERGYTETLFGRRRNFEALNSPIPYIRAAAERAAMNAPLQGTAADIIKLAMVKANEFLRREKLQDKVFLILQVHDELVYEADSMLAEKLAPKIKEIMENVLPAKESRGVPIVAEASVGENWGEMTKVTN